MAERRTGAGRLRHRIEIHRLTQTPNGKGGYNSAWAPIATPYAEIIGLSGRESVLAMALQGVSSYRITIRWRGGNFQKDQILLPDGKRLNIRSADDPNGRREWLEILADDESVVREA